MTDTKKKRPTFSRREARAMLRAAADDTPAGPRRTTIGEQLSDRERIPAGGALTMAVALGDCRKVLAEYADGCVGAVVSDPPYGLSFMGKGWDHGVPGVDFWREIERVLKPGGYVLAFGGTRTFHRLAVGLEDAGLEIRDCLSWLYGQGFPKSLNVSKAIDREAGEVRPVVGSYTCSREIGKVRPAHDGKRSKAVEVDITAAVTPAAKEWQGYGTALKPAWEPVIVARKPFPGTVAANVQAHGTGALNIDGCRVGEDVTVTIRNGHSGEHGRFGLDTRKFRRENPPGRWPPNVVLDQEAAELLDAQAPATQSAASVGKRTGKDAGRLGAFAGQESAIMGHDDAGGTSRFFYTAKADHRERNLGLEDLEPREYSSGCGGDMPTDDQGRERDRFKAKAPNDHPTVKPVDLMRWLVRLVKPPRGVPFLVLDPFCGSGTTGVACAAEGVSFLGIDQDPRSVAIARERLRIARDADEPEVAEHRAVKAGPRQARFW